MRASCPLGALPQLRPNKGSSLASPQTMAKGRVRSGHVLTCGVAAIANGFMEVLPPCIEALPQRVPPAARRTEDTGLGGNYTNGSRLFTEKWQLRINLSTVSGRLQMGQLNSSEGLAHPPARGGPSSL